MLRAGTQVSYVVQGKVLPTPAAVGVCWRCPCVLCYDAEPAGSLVLAEHLPTFTDTAATAGPQREHQPLQRVSWCPWKPRAPAPDQALSRGDARPLQWVPFSQACVPVALQNICSGAD